MSQYDKYVSPLSERYASKEMQYIFSDGEGAGAPHYPGAD